MSAIGPFRVQMLGAAAESLKVVIGHIAAAEPELLDETATFGALGVRSIRGTASPSKHSFGTSIDIGSTKHGLARIGVSPAVAAGNPALMFAARIAPYFERNGWAWGGRWPRAEAGHFELGIELLDRLIGEGKIRVRKESGGTSPELP